MSLYRTRPAPISDKAWALGVDESPFQLNQHEMGR